MNFDNIEEKKKLYQQIKANLSNMEQQNEDSAFAIEFTHDSTALEGNSLSLSETKTLLEDGIVPDGGKELRELYEVINHAKAFDFIKEKVSLGLSTDEEFVKGIHKIVTDRILPPFLQGEYRRNNVRIQGAINIPPRYEKVEREMNRFFETHKQKSIEVHPVEKAAWTHAEFVRVHPFVDGNGRTARLLLNYELMQEGFPAITFNKEDRNRYSKGLEQYSAYGNFEPFAELVKNKVEKQLDFYISHFSNHLEETEKQQEIPQKTIKEFDKLQDITQAPSIEDLPKKPDDKTLFNAYAKAVLNETGQKWTDKTNQLIVEKMLKNKEISSDQVKRALKHSMEKIENISLFVRKIENMPEIKAIRKTSRGMEM